MSCSSRLKKNFWISTPGKIPGSMIDVNNINTSTNSVVVLTIIMDGSPILNIVLVTLESKIITSGGNKDKQDVKNALYVETPLINKPFFDILMFPTFILGVDNLFYFHKI